MAIHNSPPKFLPFDGTYNDLFLEITDHVKNLTPADKKILFWEEEALKIARKITTNLLFEAVTLAFFEKHGLELIRYGPDAEFNSGFFDFRFPAMTAPDNVFEYIGGEGMFVCFSNDNHSLSIDNLKKDPTVKKYLNLEEKKDLGLYMGFLEDLKVYKNKTILPVAKHLEEKHGKEKEQGVSPMKKKYPKFYPYLERRILAGQLPKKSTKNPSPKKIM